MSVAPYAFIAWPETWEADGQPPAAVAAANSPVDILSRLRLETRADHDAIDRTLDFTSPSLTRAGYLHRLTQFFGFYQPLEALLLARSKSGAGVWFRPRIGKTALLEQDLAFFGTAPHTLLQCRELPRLETAADLLGCLYVMEGATLGGRVISRHLRAHLGVLPETGGRFFQGYGEDTRKMWMAMREALVTSVLNVDTADRVVTSATATFTSLRHWCERKTHP